MVLARYSSFGWPLDECLVCLQNKKFVCFHAGRSTNGGKKMENENGKEMEKQMR